MKKTKKLEKTPSENKYTLSLVVSFLWLLSVGSAMGVVYTTYETRRATQELEDLRREASGLQVLSGQYLLEKSVWSSYSRIEKIAKKDLHMDIPDQQKTILVYRK